MTLTKMVSRLLATLVENPEQAQVEEKEVDLVT